MSKSRERNLKSENEDRSPTFKESVFKVECPFHKGNYLTNICISEGCVEPLCPECVSIHIDLHNDLRTPAKIETLTNKRQETIKNLTELLTQFQNEKNKVLKHSDQQRNEIAQHYYSKISKAKAKILQIIESYFETLNNDVRKDMEDHATKHPGEFKHLTQRLDSIISALEKQKQNLQTQNYIKTMLKFQTAAIRQDYQILKRQIDEAIEIYSSDLKKVVLDESKIYAFNMELNKFIHLTGGNKERDALGVGYLGYEDKNSLVEKAFAIHDITNDIQNYSKYTNIYDASPQKRTNTNLSNYNFSESKIRENVRGNREDMWKDKLTQNYSFYFPRTIHKS